MRAARFDGDNGTVAATNYTRLTAIEGLTAYMSTDMVSDCFKVDFFRLGNPQFL
jgi:hypothetical protein